MNQTKTVIVVASLLTQIVIVGLAWHWFAGSRPGAQPAAVSGGHAVTVVETPVVPVEDPAAAAKVPDTIVPVALSPMAFDAGDPEAAHQDLAQTNKSGEVRRQCAELMANPPPAGGGAP